MKLYSTILEKYLDLPSRDASELRMLLDDVGLEVKDIQTVPHGHLFNIETLANRGDHLHALGVARELSGRLLSKVKYPPVAELPDRKSGVSVKITTELCKRLFFLEMTIAPQMVLREDIASVIAEEIKHHPLVYYLNYVALEVGQPMHAFDKDKIEGEILIEQLDKETEIEALDGKTYKVPAGAVIHRDRKKIIDVAGIIGCANTMVSATTSRVLVEAACFDPVSIRKTARAMGISTDASYTFERGSDIEMPIPALKRLVYLLQTGSGEAAPHVVGLYAHQGEQTEKRKVLLRLPVLREQVNLPRLQDVEVSTRLKNLGYGVDHQANAKEMAVQVPSWRLWDVENEADLIEDFVRSFGLNNVKQELPPLDYETPPYNENEKLLQKIEPVLTGNGFFEVITRSFYSNDEVTFLEELDPSLKGKHVGLKNSIESSYSHLKVTNALHFAALAAQNERMQVQSIKIFELGRLFSMDSASTESYESDSLCLGVSGRWYEGEWRKTEPLEELFSHFKGVIEGLFRSLGRELHISESKNKYLHPGFQGSLISHRETMGYFGVVHPTIKERYELRGDLLYAQLDGAKLYREVERHSFTMPIDLPTIRRDITMMVGKQDLAGKLIQHVAAMKIEILSDIAITDDFKKDNEEFRRVTYRLTFQHGERTLEHGEVDSVMNDILSTLKSKHGYEMAL